MVSNMVNVNVNEKITFDVTVEQGDNPLPGVSVSLLDTASSNLLASAVTTDGSGVASFEIAFSTAGTYVVYASVGVPVNIDSNKITITVSNVITLDFITSPANDTTIDVGTDFTMTATYKENGTAKSGVPVSFYATFVSEEFFGTLTLPDMLKPPLIGTVKTDADGVATYPDVIEMLNPTDQIGDAGSFTVYAVANGITSKKSTLDVRYLGAYSADLTEST